jgi:hypothetical protein
MYNYLLKEILIKHSNYSNKKLQRKTINMRLYIYIPTPISLENKHLFNLN